jgi:hypothetical protein
VAIINSPQVLSLIVVNVVLIVKLVKAHKLIVLPVKVINFYLIGIVKIHAKVNNNLIKIFK